MAKEKKQFRQLSDEELEKVTGGAGIDCSLPENKDKFQCRDKFKVQGATWGQDSFDFKTITLDVD